MSKTSTDNKTKSTEETRSGPNKCLPNMDYVKNMRGELYEKICSAKIFKDFYLEDLAYPSKKITPNFQMNFDKFKNEIAPFLIIGEKPEKPELMKKISEIKSKIENCLSSFLAKNNEIQKEFSDSDITTDDEPNKKEIKKTLKHVEMDYVAKKIIGKKINDCFKKLGDRKQELFKSFEIDDKQYYNICFEMTVRNDDIKKKKIFQIYKYAIWINLLQDITNLIMSAENDVKAVFCQLLNKIKSSYGIIDYKCKTILIIACIGNKEKFDTIKENINDQKNQTKYLKKLTEECKNRFNLYCNYYAFQYDDNSQMKNLYEKEKEERQKDQNEFLREKTAYEEKLFQYQKEKENYLNEIKGKNQEYLKEKEKNDNRISKLENEIIKERENSEKKISKVINDCEKKISETKNDYERKMSEAKCEFSKEREKYEKRIEEIKVEMSKERGDYEKKISEAKSDYEKKMSEAKSDYEKNMAEAKSEFSKEKEKYEKRIEEIKSEMSKERTNCEKKIEEAKNEIKIERENFNKFNESLIAKLQENSELKLRIFKLELLLKENNISLPF